MSEKATNLASQVTEKLAPWQLLILSIVAVLVAGGLGALALENGQIQVPESDNESGEQSEVPANSSNETAGGNENVTLNRSMESLNSSEVPG